MSSISIVIPAYNEEERIGNTVRRIVQHLRKRKHRFEIIVVDDGSKDRTAEVVQRLPYRITLLRNKVNRGKGYCVRRGVLRAKSEWILFSDADLSTPIAELENLLQHKADVIIGSRALAQSHIMVHQPFYREYGGKLFNLIVRTLAVGDIKDTQCGFKLFRKRAAHDIFRRQRIERFAFDVEVLYIARKRKYRISEVPVAWSNDCRTKVRFLRDSTRMLRDLLHIRFLDLRGRYD